MSRVIYCLLMTILSGVLNGADLPNQTEFGLDYVKILNAWNVAGMAVTVVSRDNVTARGFGYKDNFGSEMTEDTGFFIGSLTKAFTATLATIILHKHNIHLKDRVDSFYDINLATEEQKDANMLDLLAHRVGAGSYDFFWLTRGTEEGTDVLENPITHKLDVVYQGFRSVFIFSNLMYWVAGEAIEALFSNRYTQDLTDEEANRTWCDLVTDYVINEVDMDETTCEWRDTGRDGLGGLMASQLLWNGTNFEDIPPGIADQWQNVLAATGLISSGRDMKNWIRFNLKLYHPEAVNDELHKSLKNTHKLYMGIDNPYAMKLQDFGVSFYTYGYGLGWYLANYRGFPVLYHDGRLLGHQNLIWLIPDIEFGVYLGLTGGTNDTIQNLILQAMYLTDLFSGNLSKPWLTEYMLINWRNLFSDELYYPPTHPHMLQPLYSCKCEINTTNSQVRYCDKEHIYYKLDDNGTYIDGTISHPKTYSNALYGDMEIVECSSSSKIDNYQPSKITTNLCMKLNKFIGEIQPTNITDIYHVKPLEKFVYIQKTVFQRPLLISITMYVAKDYSFFEHVHFKVCGLTLDPEIPPLFQSEDPKDVIEIVLPIVFIILPLFLLGLILNSHKSIRKKFNKYFLSKIPYKIEYKHGFKVEKREKEAVLLESPRSLSERQKLVNEIRKPHKKKVVIIDKDEEDRIFKGIKGRDVKNIAQVQISEDEQLGGREEDLSVTIKSSDVVVFGELKASENQDQV